MYLDVKTFLHDLEQDKPRQAMQKPILKAFASFLMLLALSVAFFACFAIV